MLYNILLVYCQLSASFHRVLVRKLKQKLHVCTICIFRRAGVTQQLSWVGFDYRLSRDRLPQFRLFCYRRP